MFKGIAASLVVVGVFFFMNGCKNDAAASESSAETKSVVADTPTPDSPKASEKKEDAPKEPAPDKEDDTPEVASATKTDETPDAPTSTGEEGETAKPETEEPAAPVASTATETSEKTAGVELTATEGVQLADLTVARGIEAKKPLDPRNSYTLGEYERIVAFMSVLNPAETEDELHVSFLDTSNGRERGKVSVRVGAQKKWRTWAYSKTINKAGKWEILVRNKDGLVIGRAPFEILPAS